MVNAPLVRRQRAEIGYQRSAHTILAGVMLPEILRCRQTKKRDGVLTVPRVVAGLSLLKDYFGSNLDLSGQIGLCSDHSKTGAGCCCVRRGELCMVEKIECFKPQLQIGVFAQVKPFEQ